MASGSHNAHSRLAPSAASRWAKCTASVRYIQENQHRIPEDKGSVYANEGTEAHDWAEKVLTGKISRDKVPTQFMPHLGVYLDHIDELRAANGEEFIEVQVPLFYSPNDNGTCDYAMVWDDLVIIRDLKYGAGVRVDAEFNAQLAIYGLSLIHKLSEDPLYEFTDDTVCDFGIVQPRFQGEEPIRSWKTTIGELRPFVERMKATAQSIWANTDDLTFAPSESACRWCPAKAFCEARIASLTDDVGVSADALAALPDLTKEEKKLPIQEKIAVRMGEQNEDTLVKLYAKRKEIKSWLEDIEEYLTERATSGNPMPGTKLVIGRQGNRTWIDPEQADKVLGRKLGADERYIRKLISPAQAEAALDLKNQSTRFKNVFDSLVNRAEGQPVLALESDPRPAINAGLDLLPDTDHDDLQ